MKRWVEITKRERRHRIIRKKVSGTKDVPRMNVYRSLTNLYVQLIDDEAGKTIVSLATNAPGLKDKVKNTGGNVKGAVILGEAVAELCKGKGIKKIVFDRAGYLYHGRVKALAEAARKGGLEF
ncbi:MAG: 50S ribosomal protein L18 [Candidatus Omnitrophota bacterium]